VALVISGLLAVAALAFFLVSRRHSRRVEQLEQRLKSLQAEEDSVFDFLHGIGEAFSEGVPGPALHRLIAESAVRILGAEGGALYLAGESGSQLSPAFVSKGCPAFVPVPESLSKPDAGGAALQSFLELQQTDDPSGILGDIFHRSGEPEILAPGGRGFSLQHTALAGALSYGQRPLGVLAVARPASRGNFSEKDKKLFRTLAEQGAFALHTESVYREAGEKKLLDRDLEIARDVQRILLPDTPPAFPGYELSAVSHAARHLSGDYFDYIPLGLGRLGVAIADVSGKGVPASLIMAMCRGVLRREAGGAGTASEVLRRVNNQLYPDIKEDMFVSMAYAVFEAGGGHVTLARAGHDAPLLYRAADGSVEKVNPRGMALGIDSGEVFNRVCADSSFAMEPGDCMLLYTDGATEALDSRGVEYGLDRLSLALRASAPQGAAAVVRHVSGEVAEFTARDLRHDDFTLIAISKK
jgi:sigma-B regulation protein RsbU (phosphoserine phosphatase)